MQDQVHTRTEPGENRASVWDAAGPPADWMDDLYNSIAVTDAGRINHRKSRTIWPSDIKTMPCSRRQRVRCGRTCLERRARTRLQKRPASICSFHEARAAICGWWQSGWYNRIPRALIPVSEAVHVRRHSLGSSRTHGLDRDPLIVLRD